MYGVILACCVVVTPSFYATESVYRANVMVQDITQLRMDLQQQLEDERQKRLEVEKKLKQALYKLESLKNQRESKKITTIVTFKASPFRLKNEAIIYDNFENPKPLMRWEAGRSFTSNQRTQGWIKITGYFKNKVWQAAAQELWVRESDVIKRESK
jgi:regulator of replication initiation timing